MDIDPPDEIEHETLHFAPSRGGSARRGRILVRAVIGVSALMACYAVAQGILDGRARSIPWIFQIVLGLAFIALLARLLHEGSRAARIMFALWHGGLFLVLLTLVWLAAWSQAVGPAAEEPGEGGVWPGVLLMTLLALAAGGFPLWVLLGSRDARRFFEGQRGQSGEDGNESLDFSGRHEDK